MLRTSLTTIGARKLRLLATSVAVLLGVAFMAGTFVLTDTIGRSFDQVFTDIYADTDAVVRGESAFTGDFGDERPLVDAALADTVAAVDGVAEVHPEVEGHAQVVGADGSVIGDGAAGSLGLSWTDATTDLLDVDEGRAPAAAGEVAIDRHTATTGELEVGDTAAVLTPAGNQDMTVVGIVRHGDADTLAGTSLALFDLDTATALMGEEGKVSSFAVIAEDGVAQQTLATRIGDVLPDGTEAVTAEAVAEEEKSDLQDALGFLNTFLLVFAAISLVVGAFIIYNTFSILVAQRAKENALLRAIGASRRQVLGAVLLESVAVGLLASLVGLLAGIGVAAALKSLLATLGLDLPAGGVALEPRTVVVSLLAGLGVSVVSAVVPARRASKVPPVAALRDVAVDDSGRSRTRLVVGSATTLLGVAAMAAGVSGPAAGTVALGALLVILGVAALGPVLAVPVVRVLGAPLARTRGMTGSLARQNALRNPKRTASTSSALMIGVALVGAISIIAASARATTDDIIEGSFTGDYVVSSSSLTSMGGVSPEMAERLRQLPEVGAVTPLRFGAAEIAGSSRFVAGLDASTVDQVFALDVVDGSLADLGADGVAVGDEDAEELGLAVGDTVDARFATGDAPLRVAAVYDDTEALSGYLLDLAAFEAHFQEQLDSQVILRVVDGVSPAAAEHAIGEVTAAYPQVEVQDRTEFKEAQAGTVTSLLNMVYALLALAVVIALIGIANTLALSILERTRELGLLRAVGMTRSQLRAVVRWEAVLISVLGAVLGLAIAVGFGWALVESLRHEGLTTFALPAVRLVVIVVLAGLAGVGASLLPSRRAARLDVLRAVTAD